MFAVVTLLHHTHPRMPWFRTKQESSFFAGQVQATVHVELPAWLELVLHNITVHNAHHVDARIPFQHLPEAQHRSSRSARGTSWWSAGRSGLSW